MIKKLNNGRKLEKSVKILSYSKNKEILKGFRVKVGLIIILWRPYATNDNKKVAHHHKIIKLINISYITKCLYIYNQLLILRNGSKCYI